MLVVAAGVLWVATVGVLLAQPGPHSALRMFCFVLPVVATGASVLALLPRVLGDYFRSITLGYVLRDREARDGLGGDRSLQLVRGGSS